MSRILTYSFGDTSAAQVELEKLREDDDSQGLYDRCFRNDINAPMFIRSLKSLSHGWFSPTTHKSLWQKLADPLKRYMRPCGDLLFNANLLPGNGNATSATISLDGKTFVYLTYSAVGLEELGTRRALSKEEYMAAQKHGADKDSPMMINIIETSPYRIRSIAVDLSDGFAWGGIPRLLEIDDNSVYIIGDTVSDGHSIIKVPRDGSPRIEKPLEFHCPGRCYHFDASHSRIWYIDLAVKALVEAEIDKGIINQSPILIPEDLDGSQLHELVMTNDGKIMYLSVDHRRDYSRYSFALGASMRDPVDQEAECWSMRWFRVKDLDGPTCISNCLLGPAYDSLGHARADDTFYCLDRKGVHYILNLEPIRNEPGALDALDASSMMMPCSHAGAKKDTWISSFALARTLPLAVSYSMNTKCLQVWDTARKHLLFELKCPYNIDAVFFLQEDRLLVTVERSMGLNHGTVAVTFLDYALLMGKPPVLYNASDHVRLLPLLAVAPNDPELKLLEQIIRYFADIARADYHASPAEPKGIS